MKYAVIWIRKAYFELLKKYQILLRFDSLKIFSAYNICLMRWYGHVKRKPPDYVGNLALLLDLPGRRPRGRPRTRWRDVVLKDKRECNVADEDVEDRAKWRSKVRKADPTTMWDK